VSKWKENDYKPCLDRDCHKNQLLLLLLYEEVRVNQESQEVELEKEEQAAYFLLSYLVPKGRKLVRTGYCYF